MSFIKIINLNLYVFSRHQVLFFSFNFSCCKAHDFCELNLRKLDKCGGNLRNIDQRFEYDAATDTCSNYYQFFLCIISVLSFVVVCIILPKSLASTFPHSPIRTEIYTLKNYLCVSLVGRTMYFHSRSLAIFEMCRLVRENLSMYKIKTSDHGKCFNDFYSRVAMHRKSQSFAAFTRSFS